MKNSSNDASAPCGDGARIPLLSAHEEHRLATAWVESRDHLALDKILRHHRPLVTTLARKLKIWGQSQEDLEQDGMIGLLKAVDAFDPSRGVRFCAFARHYVMAEMLASTRSLRGPVRVPISSDAAAVFTKYSKAKASWQSQNGRDIDDEGLDEIADKLEVSRVTVRRLEAWRSPRAVELDARSGEDGNTLLDTLTADGSDQEELLCEREAFEVMVRSLASAVAELPERDQRVLGAIYGGKGAGASSIARELGVSHQRVGQLRQRALERLRMNLAPIKALVEGR